MDSKALIDALKAQKLGAVGLDTYEEVGVALFQRCWCGRSVEGKGNTA